MVCSPIFHSVQKKRGPNSCVILFMGLYPTATIEQSSLWKGAVERGTIADASLSLAATLSHTACVVLRLVKQYRSTAAIEEGHKNVHNWSCLKATMTFGIGNVRVNKQLPRNQWSFHFRYPAKEGISFPKHFCTSSLVYTSSYPKTHINVSDYTDFYVFNVVEQRVECDITRLEV